MNIELYGGGSDVAGLGSQGAHGVCASHDLAILLIHVYEISLKTLIHLGREPRIASLTSFVVKS